MCIGYWWENHMERDHWVDNIKIDVGEIVWGGIN
jgi:hypothetical protein